MSSRAARRARCARRIVAASAWPRLRSAQAGGLARVAPSADAALADQPAAGVRRGFSLEGDGSPALTALRDALSRRADQRRPSATELAEGRLLLMAHPPAQTAGEPGRARRLGAPRRAGAAARRPDARMAEQAPARRSAPAAADVHGYRACSRIGVCGSTRRTSAGRRVAQLGGLRVLTVSPGRSVRQLRDQRGPAWSRDCRIGKGRATVVADADFLNVGDLGAEAHDNLERVLERACRKLELSWLIRVSSQTYPQGAMARTGEEQTPATSREKPRKSGISHVIPIKSHQNPLYPASSLSYQHRL